MTQKRWRAVEPAHDHCAVGHLGLLPILAACLLALAARIGRYYADGPPAPG